MQSAPNDAITNGSHAVTGNDTNAVWEFWSWVWTVFKSAACRLWRERKNALLASTSTMPKINNTEAGPFCITFSDAGKAFNCSLGNRVHSNPLGGVYGS